MIKVGFSTGKKNILSWLIRTVTRSSASHAWLLIEDHPLYGVPMVLEATEVGFREISYDRFRLHKDVVLVLDPKYDLTPGIRALAPYLGSGYDFAGLFGMSYVEVMKRWFKRKVRNPVRSKSVWFCSEAVVRVFQAAGVPGSDQLDPDSTSPKDIMDFLASR